jgi:hypothetical protein
MNPCYTSPSISCSGSDSCDVETDVFWLETLRDYDIGRPLPLSFDRQRISLNDRTERVWSIVFNFDSNLLSAFVDFSSTMNTTIDYLVFTSYYIFLFKLTNGEKDLCVGRNIAVRYKSQLYHLNDTFVNT